MRYSTDEITDGIVKNGFDYDLQVWVKNYKIVLAGSQERTKALEGTDIRELKNTKKRP